MLSPVGEEMRFSLHGGRRGFWHLFPPWFVSAPFLSPVTPTVQAEAAL